MEMSCGGRACVCERERERERERKRASKREMGWGQRCRDRKISLVGMVI